MSERPTHDVAAGTNRMIRALGRRVGDGNPGDLLYLTQLHEVVDRQLAVAVANLRYAGHTDSEIAAVLGVTRQAVSKRWPDGGRRVGAAARYPRHQ